MSQSVFALPRIRLLHFSSVRSLGTLLLCAACLAMHTDTHWKAYGVAKEFSTLLHTKQAT